MNANLIRSQSGALTLESVLYIVIIFSFCFMMINIYSFVETKNDIRRHTAEIAVVIANQNPGMLDEGDVARLTIMLNEVLSQESRTATRAALGATLLDTTRVSLATGSDLLKPIVEIGSNNGGGISLEEFFRSSPSLHSLLISDAGSLTFYNGQYNFYKVNVSADIPFTLGIPFFKLQNDSFTVHLDSSFIALSQTRD